MTLLTIYLSFDQTLIARNLMNTLFFLLLRFNVLVLLGISQCVTHSNDRNKVTAYDNLFTKIYTARQPGRLRQRRQEKKMN